jgi:hypothetical protein
VNENNMDDTRRMLAEVFAQDDLVRRDFACWEAKRQQQQREQQEREQRQAVHATEQRTVREWLTRTAGDDMRTTDFLDERNAAGKNGSPQPQQFMNDREQAHWDAWCKAIARAEADKIVTEVNNQIVDDLDKFNDALRERFDRRKAHFEQRDADLQSWIDELESRLADLEARVADLEGSGEQQKVVPLLTFKGGRDAA